MDEIDDPLQARFAAHVDAVYRSLDALYPQLHDAVRAICDTLLAECRLIVCGSGQCVPLVQLFGASLLNRANMERPGLPVILLGNDAAVAGAIAESYGTSEVLARQIQAIGQDGDTVLLVTSMASNAVAPALRAARARGARAILLCAESGADPGPTPGPDALELRIPADDPCRVGECQLLVLNCMVDLIEQRLFGGP